MDSHPTEDPSSPSHHDSFYEDQLHVLSHTMNSDSPEESEQFNDDELETLVMSATHHYCSQIIDDAPTENLLDCDENVHDDQYLISQTMMRQLNLIPSINTRITTDNMAHHARPHPPMMQSGMIDEHDRPFAEYGHLGNLIIFVFVSFTITIEQFLHCLDAASIATSCHFDLDGKETQRRREKNQKRMEAKSWAITAWSDVSSKYQSFENHMDHRS